MEFEKLSKEFVKLTVTTEGSDLGCERSFSRNITVGELKQRMELLTGASYNRMKLELRSQEIPNELVDSLNEDHRKLSEYPKMESGLLLKVIDPTMSIFNETDEIAKIEISEDRYRQVKNVRSFLETHGLGRFSNRTDDAPTEDKEKTDKEYLNDIEVGRRCEVRTKGSPIRLGNVTFIGEICLKPGVTFVGVKLDEPLGKNDGTVGGNRYFECEPKYGVFVRPCDVVVGDFPEINLEDELDEM